MPEVIKQDAISASDENSRTDRVVSSGYDPVLRTDSSMGLFLGLNFMVVIEGYIDVSHLVIRISFSICNDDVIIDDNERELVSTC